MDLDRADIYLKAFKKVLDDLEIPFFLWFGTLLGSVREKDFIPHDTDVDIGMLKKHIPRDKVDAVVKGFEGTGYSVCIGSCDGYVNLIYITMNDKYPGLKVDADFLFDFQDKYWFPRHANVNGNPITLAIPYSKKYFDCEMEERTIRGTKYRVPSPPEEFLVELWGEDWRVPKPGAQFGIIKATHFKPEDFKPKEYETR